MRPVERWRDTIQTERDSSGELKQRHARRDVPFVLWNKGPSCVGFSGGDKGQLVSD